MRERFARNRLFSNTTFSKSEKIRSCGDLSDRETLKSFLNERFEELPMNSGIAKFIKSKTNV